MPKLKMKFDKRLNVKVSGKDYERLDAERGKVGIRDWSTFLRKKLGCKDVFRD